MIIVNDKIAPITITVTKRIVDGLYIGDNKKIDVSKIDVGKDGIKFAYSTFSKVPEYFSFENVTDGSHMFYNSNLEVMPDIDYSKLTNTSYMFAGSLIDEQEYAGRVIDLSNCTDTSFMFNNTPLFDIRIANTNKVFKMDGMFADITTYSRPISPFPTDSVQSMQSMFRRYKHHIIPEFEYRGNCNLIFDNAELLHYDRDISMPLVKLLTNGFRRCKFIKIRNCDFSGIKEEARGIFEQCDKLEKIGDIDLHNSRLISYLFLNCTVLNEVGDIRCDSCTGGTIAPITKSNITNQITLGGFSGLGKSATRQIVLNLTFLRGLTEQSVINIANTIEPNTSSYAHQCRINSTILNSLSDETIALFTNKNWTIRN